MDLNLDAESRILRESARAFLSRACGADHVRAMESDASGFDRDLWRRAGELGWAGMILPERFGGAGRTFLDLAILLEECGRVLLPSPLFATA
ncbi:MAG: acyl-CoA dehydrogenase family protein, partial [Candidatus Binatia bacterium]